MQDEERRAAAPQLNDHVFALAGGRSIVDGKSHYPDLVRLRLSKEQAMDMAYALFTAARAPSHDDMIEHVMFGQLEAMPIE